MKTLAKFENANAKVTYKMSSSPEEYVTLDGLYFVHEEPKKKNSSWIATTRHFSYSEDAIKYFNELISFWLR